MRVGSDRALELRRRIECKDSAVVHDRHAIAELIGLFHVVGREQDRLALVVELAQDLPQGEAALRVEPGRGFVEEQDAGAGA